MNPDEAQQHESAYYLKEAERMLEQKIWSEMEQMQGQIAQVLRQLLGEEQYDQRIFTDEERARRIDALKLVANKDLDMNASHQAWLDMHVEQGWTYGPEFLPSEKKHPNIKPWDELPLSTRAKATIFAIVAQTAQKLCQTVI